MISFYLCHERYADVAELADAPDSGSGESNFIWVQVPSSAPARQCRHSIFRVGTAIFYHTRGEFCITARSNGSAAVISAATLPVFYVFFFST